VISEVVAGSVANPELGPRVVELCSRGSTSSEGAVRRVLAPTPFAELADPHELALAAVTSTSARTS